MDDIDLRVDEGDPNESGDEDAGETPAEKILRLAKLYLGYIVEGLSASLPPGSYSPGIYHSTFSADGEVDAAEIDKGLKSARLKQDVRGAGCPRTYRQATFICGRFCEYHFVVCDMYMHVPAPHPL